jgi:GNAT superfamily N-acetyltransferase
MAESEKSAAVESLGFRVPDRVRPSAWRGRLTFMELVDMPDFGADDFAAIVDGEVDPFGTESLEIEWREKTGHVGLMHDGRLIGHAGWVPVEARSSEADLVEAVGLGGVMVHRAHRGAGLGRRLVSGAMERMQELDRPLGLLFCRTARVQFYQRLGWHPIQHDVTVDQPGGEIAMPLATCWTPLSDGASEPTTALHIEGLPF